MTSSLPPVGTRCRVRHTDSVTASLHGATGVVTKHRTDRRDQHRFHRSRVSKRDILGSYCFLKFDRTQRGAGSIMTGVWLQDHQIEEDQ